MALPSRADMKAMAKREAGNVERYFNRDRGQFEFMGYLNNGVTGVSCRVRLRSNGRRRAQQFVVKRGFRSGGGVQERLEKERRTLKNFRGAAHTLQLFYPPRGVRNPIDDAPGQTLVTEWIENGTLADFVHRNGTKALPNRVLIEFFGCLVQFCVAMAYPPRGAEREPQREERISGRQKSNLAHNDMHCSNIMIGSLNPECGGHGLVPQLKLIDFDRASIIDSLPGLDYGVASNIFAIGMVMRSLITGDLMMEPPPPVAMTIFVNGSSRHVVTRGGDCTTARHRNLDTDLASLVMWCLADIRQRPVLEDLHASVTTLRRKATNTARWRNYPLYHFESESEVRRIVQRYILDA
ncbi:kinase-like domain-containing protein [Nemania sp. NC0429]|nr:kinase-like domain-containing protein [Nemania sp. NC0429]